MLRRLTAEALGSLLLAATVIGSGIMAERLAGGNMAVALLANTGATVAVHPPRLNSWLSTDSDLQDFDENVSEAIWVLST
jgi:hypothetical protein